MQNPQGKTVVVVGAMHRVAEGQMFSKCVHCGAMAEKLKKPCPAYMAEAAQLLEEAKATGSTP